MASDTAIDLRRRTQAEAVRTRGRSAARADSAGESRRPETADRSQLTENFGVSRTVVREAIATLAADGLVESRQGAGVFVADHPTSPSARSPPRWAARFRQALNVLEVRLGIEVESAALAAQPPQRRAGGAIQEAFFEFERLLARREPTGPADFAFHRDIAAATNNPFYVEMLDALGDAHHSLRPNSPWIDRTGAGQYLTRPAARHLVILNAISAGDPQAARDAMRAHLTAARSAIASGCPASRPILCRLGRAAETMTL